MGANMLGLGIGPLLARVLADHGPDICARGSAARGACAPTSSTSRGSRRRRASERAARARGAPRVGGGRLDGPTSTAIRRFQKEEALAETGFPDRDTLRRLGIDPESAYRTAEKQK
jgi:hypothetical protein